MQDLAEGGVQLTPGTYSQSSNARPWSWLSHLVGNVNAKKKNSQRHVVLRSDFPTLQKHCKPEPRDQTPPFFRSLALRPLAHFKARRALVSGLRDQHPISRRRKGKSPQAILERSKPFGNKGNQAETERLGVPRRNTPKKTGQTLPEQGGLRSVIVGLFVCLFVCFPVCLEPFHQCSQHVSRGARSITNLPGSCVFAFQRHSGACFHEALAGARGATH